MTLHIGWFSSGKDEAARNLLGVVHDDLLANGAPATIDWVFCNREPGDGPFDDEAANRAEFFSLAEGLGIPVKALSHVQFMPELRKEGLAESASVAEASPALERWRNLYGREVMAIVREAPVDIVVMAGYMLIIGDPELQGLDIVNIHPALPWGPRGTWQECIHEIIETDAEEHGIMIHLVTKTLDRGPVISYCRFPVRGGEWEPLRQAWHDEITRSTPRPVREAHPLFQHIRSEGEVRELPLLSTAITELAFGNIEIRDRSIWAGGHPREEGVDLTEQIEESVSALDALDPDEA